jgi:hypothetical protein
MFGEEANANEEPADGLAPERPELLPPAMREDWMVELCRSVDQTGTAPYPELDIRDARELPEGASVFVTLPIKVGEEEVVFWAVPGYLKAIDDELNVVFYYESYLDLGQFGKSVEVKDMRLRAAYFVTDPEDDELHSKPLAKVVDGLGTINASNKGEIKSFMQFAGALLITTMTSAHPLLWPSTRPRASFRISSRTNTRGGCSFRRCW